MPIRPESRFPNSTVQILKRCYRFVSREWQRAKREPLPDEGFEQRFRESCIQELQEWSIAGEREMHLGMGLETASGVLHEVDIVARNEDLAAILELKNRRGTLPDKNDVIVFFAKILDYLTANPALLSKDVCLAFMSSGSFEPSGLAACLGLGIHPIGDDVRPLPILVNSATIIESEIRKGLVVRLDILERFEDFCASLNNLSYMLSDTWIDSRCGYASEDKILVKATGPLPSMAVAQQIRQLNADLTDILREIRNANPQ